MRYQNKLINSDEISNRVPYEDPNHILKSENPFQATKAMQEYSLKRSFSEKLEKKKHLNLNSYFAVIENQEKYKLVSQKLGNIHKKKSKLIEAKSTLDQDIKEEHGAEWYKNKYDTIEMKLSIIDKEIYSLLQDKSEIVTTDDQKYHLGHKLTPSPVSKLPTKNQILRRTDAHYKNIVVTDKSPKPPMTKENSVPLFFTPNMVKSSIKRLKSLHKL